VKLAAQAALLGIDPLLVLEEPDPLTFAVLQAVVHYAAELADRRDENLAIRIANALGRVLR
jgi:hypothetical protein